MNSNPAISIPCRRANSRYLPTTGWSKFFRNAKSAGWSTAPEAWSTAHASAGHSSKPRVVSAVIAYTNAPPTISTLVMNGAAAGRYSCSSVIPSTGARYCGEARWASNSSWLENRPTPRPLPPWLCLLMNGTGSFLAAADSSAVPATASVCGTSNPAARSAVIWSALLTSSSSTRRPFTTRRPWDSSQHSTARAWSLA